MVVVVVVVVVPAPGDPIDQTRRPDVNLPRSAPHRLAPSPNSTGRRCRSVGRTVGRTLCPPHTTRCPPHSTAQHKAIHP